MGRSHLSASAWLSKVAPAVLASFVELSSDGILVLDGGRVVAANPAAEQLFGRSARELCEHELASLVPLARERACAVSEGFHACRGAHANGAPLELELALLTVPQQPTQIAILRQRNAGATLERRMLEREHEVRARIGQDLHDGPAQLLTGFVFLVDSLMDAIPPGHAASARRLIALARQTSLELRQIARGLYSPQNERDELGQTLRELAADTQALYHIDCHFETDGGVETDSVDTRTQLYLIAREAIHNAVEHGHATQLSLCLSRREGHRELSICDEGVGFDPDEVHVGVGLRSMQSRATRIGGTLEVLSRPPRGTTIRCRW